MEKKTEKQKTKKQNRIKINIKIANLSIGTMNIENKSLTKSQAATNLPANPAKTAPEGAPKGVKQRSGVTENPPKNGEKKEWKKGKK